MPNRSSPPSASAKANKAQTLDPSAHSIQISSNSNCTGIVSLSALPHIKIPERDYLPKNKMAKRSDGSTSKHKSFQKHSDPAEYYNQDKLGGRKKLYPKTEKSLKSKSDSSRSQHNRTSFRKEKLAKPLQPPALTGSTSIMNKKVKTPTGGKAVGIRMEDITKSRLSFHCRLKAQESSVILREEESKTKSKESQRTNNKDEGRNKKRAVKNGKSRSKKKKNKQLISGKTNGSLKNKEKTNRNSSFTKQSVELARLEHRHEPKGTLPTSSMLKDEDDSLSLIRHNVLDEMGGMEPYQKLSAEVVRERFKSVSMLGKICSSMRLKRTSFFLSLAYLDRFIDSKTETRSIKAAAIASLMIALKVEHAEVFGSLVYQLNGVPHLESHTREAERSPQMISTPKKSLQTSEKNEKAPVLSLNRQRTPNVLNVVLSHQEIFSQYERILCKEQIMDIEMQIMIRLNFRLELKAISHWTTLLYGLWEKYLEQLSLEGSELFSDSILQKLPLIRQKTGLNIIEYLSAMTEVCQLIPACQSISKPILVASLLYLLVRVRAEYVEQESEKGFEYFRLQLAKSTNVIFIDRTGTNEIFGQYLCVLGLDMRHLVSSCQQVSKLLLFRLLRGTIEEWKRALGRDSLQTYHYCPELFRYFSVRLQE